MRNRFDSQLDRLNNELILMGALIESAIASSVTALINQSREQAHQAIEFDIEVDKKEKEIESLCLKLLLQQQPVAKDLRLISSALRMITAMVRIGDQAADSSEITIMMESVDAFVKRDLQLAQSVVNYDEVVDNLFNTVKNDLIDLIREDVDNGEQAVDLLMVAKYFERIGDHATNIAEWVIFSITGTHKNARVI